MKFHKDSDILDATIREQIFATLIFAEFSSPILSLICKSFNIETDKTEAGLIKLLLQLIEHNLCV